MNQDINEIQNLNEDVSTIEVEYEIQENNDAENIMMEDNLSNTSSTDKNLTDTNEKNTTGVATYVSIPDINDTAPKCDYNLLTNYDKVNIWTSFFFIVFLILFMKREKFDNIISKITKFITNHQILLNLIFLITTMGIFLYPRFFNTGISGDINIFTMIEFSIFILLNASCFMYLKIRKLKSKNFILKDKEVDFAGMSFLKRSLWIFSITGLLFFFLTESKIAFIILYLLSSLALSFSYIKLDVKGLNAIKNLNIIFLSFQLFLIGSLLGIYVLLLTGSILTGYYLSNKDNTKKLYKIMKSII